MKEELIARIMQVLQINMKLDDLEFISGFYTFGFECGYFV